MKKICYGIWLSTILLLLPSLSMESFAASAEYGTRSDVTFYGKYEYPSEVPNDNNPSGNNGQNVPNQNTSNHSVNYVNNHTTIPQLGDVDAHLFQYLGILLISAAILLRKRKVINNEIK